MLVSSSDEMETVARGAAGNWVEVGRITKSVGLDGGLLIQLHSEDASNLLACESIRLAGRPGEIPFKVERFEPSNPAADGRARVRAWLAGLDSRERTEPWLSAGVSVPESALAPLPEGEFYWRDLIGLSVHTLGGRDLGRVEDIWPTGGVDLLVVRADGEPVLIPALRSLLSEIDTAARKIFIDPPPGLLPEDD
ncbi:MAG: 16S rRNA processing protein RimM [bacterium]|nr:16S rRNA processing protein RimM [bacterium]